MKKLLATSFLLLAPFAASAGELYTSVGLPGLTLGYAEALGESVTLRGDVTTVGSISRKRTVQAIDYDAHFKSDRVALLADWFVAGKVRLTGGATFQNTRADLYGHGNGGTIKIGNTSYVAGPSDQFDAHVQYPHAMPYLGIGFGHAKSSVAGWTFIADFGISIGRPDVSGSASGPLLSQTVTQQDIDQELASIRESTAKYRGIPQLSLGLGYRF